MGPLYPRRDPENTAVVSMLTRTSSFVHPDLPRGKRPVMRPRRLDGYVPIRDYAVIGNRRTVALVALDGSVDWLCLPKLDSPSVFGAVLDSRAGGRLALAPEEPYDVERGYVPDTNVLRTTFTTTDGTLRVTDGLTLGEDGPMPWNELVREVECLAGEVRLRWSAEPRFDYGGARGAVERHGDVPVVRAGGDALTVQCFDLGEPWAGSDHVSGAWTLREGETGMLAVSSFRDQPVLLSSRDELHERLTHTGEFWRRRAGRCLYDGRWRDSVVRSALVLDLLTDSATGAVAGAATASLPEAIGGERNFDYRFAWLRDGNFALHALFKLGYREQVHASFQWMMDTTARTHPRLRPFYGLDGTPRIGETELQLAGYRDSRPVMVGNGAGSQLQLGNFRDLMETAWLYVRDGNQLDPATGGRLAELADFLCEVWQNEDAGIWELGQHRAYTDSRMACWVALERAGRLAAAGQVPDRSRRRWAATAEAVRSFVEIRCWSDEIRSYSRFPGTNELDAAVLLAARGEYLDPAGERMNRTIDAVRRGLGRGPLLYRYSGMEDQEGCFICCSFWLVEALARAGRHDEGAEAMDEMVALANDVGLYSEQIDPDTHELLGNIPQALSHLSLITAALLFDESRQSSAAD